MVHALKKPVVQRESDPMDRFLGPARVVAVGAPGVRVALAGREAWAVMAIAYPYMATAGDVVLVIAEGDSCYVIGVLDGTGKTSLEVPGDLELRAPRGRIDIYAAEGCRIQSPSLELVAKRMEFVAGSILERFDDATRWVKNTFQLRASRVRTRANKAYDVLAGRILIRARDDVKVDGRKIYLG